MTGEEGVVVHPPDPATLRWVTAARPHAEAALADPDLRAQWPRHGGTWFVGVDALPTGPDGEIGGVPLSGPWMADLPRLPLHRAQLSAVFPGYPRPDGGESDAAHRFRVTRFGAHLDGLRPEGPERRRFLREPHAYVLGLPLDTVRDGALMVWPGSHRIMGEALRAALDGRPIAETDLTDAYAAARRQVFDRIEPRAVHADPGQAIVLHRHLLHGIAPRPEAAGPPRCVAYFRPCFQRLEDWL